MHSSRVQQFIRFFIRLHAPRSKIRSTMSWVCCSSAIIVRVDFSEADTGRAGYRNRVDITIFAKIQSRNGFSLCSVVCVELRGRRLPRKPAKISIDPKQDVACIKIEVFPDPLPPTLPSQLFGETRKTTKIFRRYCTTGVYVDYAPS